MLVSDFDFDLPRELIAISPASPRDSARLIDATGPHLIDKTIKDLKSILKAGDLLVFNDTKVIPARLLGKRKDAKVEVTLHKMLSDGVWNVFARPAKKLKAGDIFKIAEDFFATVLDKDGGEVTLKFSASGEEFYEKLGRYGSPPLPPYISRDSGVRKQDVDDYQTIYAKHRGAVAAPTAGLHFTDDMLKDIADKGIRTAFVTLHVGAGTFLPVKVEDTKDHKMHSEYCILSQETADLINDTKKAGGRIVAVGTTSLRLLESAAANGPLQKFEGDTDIFITPGYKFKVVDAMLTNFHLPKSTLFMLVSAFAGVEKMRAVYKHAIENKYRFYSYGDACFLKISK